jgi:arylsulfatase A-like enzyme
MLAFALVCGLLGEAVEVLLLERGGIVAPALRVRLILFAAYAAAGALAYLVARIAGTRRRLAYATGAFLAVLVLPWLNFDYMPQLRTLASLFGNLGALAIVMLVAWLVSRVPRAAAVTVLVLAVVVNVAGWIAARAPNPSVRTVVHDGKVRPNVVLLLIDTLRADHLGAYGYRQPTSRHIDALARDGVIFERAIAQATYTKPSVASLLTGTFVNQHGVIAARDALGAELPTLAEQLRAHGYRTAAFSANPWITPEFHFDRGFDHFESNRAIDVQLTVLYRLVRRVGALIQPRGGGAAAGAWLLRVSGEPNPSNSRRDEILTDAVIDWVEGNTATPFFAYVHLIGPHDPYDPPDAAVDRFRDPEWGTTRARVKPPPRVYSIFETATPLDARARDMMVAQYNGAIAFADRLVERMTHALQRRGLLENTLLVLTADHGEEFYEHGNWGHGVRLYQEIIGVPLLFHFPRVLPAGRRTDPAMLVDVFPTILRIADVPHQLTHLGGRDLFAPGRREEVAAYAEYFSVEGGSYASRMVLRDGFKLIETRDEARKQHRQELYDLTKDPGERHDLTQGEPARTNGHLGTLQQLLQEFGATNPRLGAPAVEIQGGTKEILRQLGYETLDRH